ncbi:MAG: HEAT repeat domain-containing protein, partial [Pyrinomonadaceae bacterium]
MSILRRLFKPKKVIEERAIPKPVTEPTEPEQPPVERLLSQLQDRSSDVRAAAARKLGYIGDNQSVEPMIAALRDEIGGSDDVQIALSEAIKKIDPTALERFTTKFSGWGWQVTPDLPGIKKLMRCTQKDILGSERETLLSQVLKELKSAKRQGSNALA